MVSGRRVMAVLRLACRVVISGRRRAVGRLGGAVAASLVLGMLGAVAPVGIGAAFAGCTLASGTYTCSGTDTAANISTGNLSAVLDSTYDTTSLTTSFGASLASSSGAFSLVTEAGSKAAGATYGIQFSTSADAQTSTITLAGDATSAEIDYGMAVSAEINTTSAITISQTAGALSGGAVGLYLGQNVDNTDITFTQSEGALITASQFGIVAAPGDSDYDVHALRPGKVNISASGTITGVGPDWSGHIAPYRDRAPSGIFAAGSDVTVTLTSTGSISGFSYNFLGNVGNGISVRADTSTLDVAGSITGSAKGVSVGGGPSTITVSGSISAIDYGLYVGSTSSIINVSRNGTVSGIYGMNLVFGSSVIDVTGRVEGTTAAILLQGDGNTLHIQNGAVFSNGHDGPGLVQFHGTSNNTVNFHTGSYTLHVAGYIAAGDAHNEAHGLGSAKTVVYDLVDDADFADSSKGTISVVSAAPVAQAPLVTADYSRSVLNLTGEIIDLDIARPLVNPTEPLGYASTKHKSNPTEIQTGSLGQGTTFDAYGNLFWLRALGGVTEKDTTSSQIGSNAQHYGLVAGVDHQYGDWRLGVFGGGGQAHTAMKDGSGELTGDLGLLGAYARVGSGRMWLDATVQGGYIRSSSERSVNGGVETATGAFNGWFTGAELALSTRIDLAPNWSLTPTLKGRYSAAFYDAYAETGSSQNVSYDSHMAQALEERFETKLTYVAPSAGGLTTKYWLKGAVSATERVGQSEFGASVLGSDFKVEALGDRTIYGGTAGIGFDAMVTKQASIFASLDGTLASDHSRSGVARGGVKIAF